jgi:cytochrome c5
VAGAVVWVQAEKAPQAGPPLVAAHVTSAATVATPRTPSPSTVARVAQTQTPSAAAPRAAAAAAAPTIDKAVLDKYCVTCHSERLKRGNLVLEGIDVADVGPHAETWEKVVRKMRASEMPPAGSPRPEPAVYKAFPESVEAALDRAAASKPNAGRVALHRLNRTEYANAIRDILAIDVDAQTLLPNDETGYGFDNIAGVLSMSPGLLERYKLAAWKIARLAVGDPGMKPSIDQYKISRLLVQDDRMSEDLPFGTRGGGVIKHNFPLDGEYSIRLELQRAYASHVIKGIYSREQIDVRLNGERVKLFEIGGECVGSKEPRCLAFRPEFDTQFGVRELPAEYDLTADKDLIVRFPAKAGPSVISVSFLKNTGQATEGAGPPRMPTTVSQVDNASGLMSIEAVRLEGPFNATGIGDTPSRQKIFVCRPASKAEEPACARRIISTIARHAYRRPTVEKDIQTLMPFYDRGRAAGTFDTGIQYALEAMLMSPNFLMRIVQDPSRADANGNYRLSSAELASRLSFFLWSSVPDDELLDLAARGTLTQPRVLDQQVRRMLRDPRATQMVNNFFGQWLGLRDLKNLSPDPAAYPDFDDSLREAFLRETNTYLDAMVREDHGVGELLNSNFTYLNERLARFYGIPGVYGPHFRRVTLTDPNRFGILGQGAILTVTSYSTRTSPVVRGKWLMTNVLGSPPPAPPPNVPALAESGAGGAPPTTVRERMQEHRKNAVCASCHSRMDPLGFALENYSAIGKWRTNESGQPIDVSGQFPDGTKFSSPGEFKQVLMARQDTFVKTVLTKLMTYALGRGVEAYDMPAVRAILKSSAASNYKWSAVIQGIVTSTPFQMNHVAEPETGTPAKQVAALQ